MIDQVAIGVCGITSVWLSQDRRPGVRRWACIFGIMAQPFWVYATLQAEQWGILILTLVYTVGWARGIWNHWIRP
ncbi:hypothetical protein UFOVP1670_41 [uncultured Caudovirales phage]|uniref:Uncharacterized protein n=1 Tax=uncultured Caudovirales phage TaxID=2100421 RepID=A0A6J5T988_9CAUD|nr:hypothetical protein UFOVP1670_41 [uncultured Caudovirales phage]